MRIFHQLPPSPAPDGSDTTPLSSPILVVVARTSADACSFPRHVAPRPSPSPHSHLPPTNPLPTYRTHPSHRPPTHTRPWTLTPHSSPRLAVSTLIPRRAVPAHPAHLHLLPSFLPPSPSFAISPLHLIPPGPSPPTPSSPSARYPSARVAPSALHRSLSLAIAAYVDDQLLATGKISKAAILGKQGGVWAASTGYNVSPAA